MLQGKSPWVGCFRPGFFLIPALTLTQSHQFQAIFLLQKEAGPGGVSQALSTAVFSCSVSMGWARKKRFPQLAGRVGVAVDGPARKEGRRQVLLLFCLPAWHDFGPGAHQVSIPS